MLKKQLNRFSVQHLAIVTVLLIGATSIGSIWAADYIFRDAILTSIKSNIKNVIAVAVQESNHKVHKHAIQFANQIQNYSELHTILKTFLKNTKYRRDSQPVKHSLYQRLC